MNWKYVHIFKLIQLFVTYHLPHVHVHLIIHVLHGYVHLITICALASSLRSSVIIARGGHCVLFLNCCKPVKVSRFSNEEELQKVVFLQTEI